MKKKSLQSKLIRLFCITAIIPIVVLSLFSYYNISYTLKENTRELTNNSLKQIDDNLQIWMESYEDLLYQIYTDDNMVAWIDKLNKGEDVSVTKNQMRRYLRGLLNTKEYIRSITVISESDMLVTYDQLTPATYKNSWLANFDLDQNLLYNKVSKDYNTHVFSTQYATDFASKDYYLFHIAHRIIDYMDLEERCGIVIISIDERFLENICTTTEENGTENNLNFIVDESGRIITYGSKSQIGRKITNQEKDLDLRIKDYAQFIGEDKNYSKQYTTAYAYHDDKLNWDVVNITDQSRLINTLKKQIAVILILSAFLFTIAIFMTSRMAKKLVMSVRKVTDTMQKTMQGDLSVRVVADNKMPIEIEDIALQFNDMLGKLSQALEKEREAQIVALEAQINPHFIYNTLDTINWMAIDKAEYDISNAINSLANILRYAIVNSNAEVTVREEVEWLKKYIFLQQFRLKNQFNCNIEVDPEAMEQKIHKLLLQPFIENAIVHGFASNSTKACLQIVIKKVEETLSITIRDNGIGMEKDMVNMYNVDIFDGVETGHHIGMENAITRLRMYYGSRGTISVSSKIGEGTSINIQIDKSNLL